MDKLNEIKIDVPEGMEYYIENNTIKFRPKIITYQDIAKELFKNGAHYVSIRNGGTSGYDKQPNIKDKGVYSISRKQLDKLVAINQLMNVAKYLNKDWQPDWNNKQENKYGFVLINNNTEIIDPDCQTVNRCFVYFKTSELAKQAINILGEETIKLALCTDW